MIVIGIILYLISYIISYRFLKHMLIGHRKWTKGHRISVLITSLLGPIVCLSGIILILSEYIMSLEDEASW